MNFGISGQGTIHEWLTYRHYVREFKPDLVVLCFFPGNDPTDNIRRMRPGLTFPVFTTFTTVFVTGSIFERLPESSLPTQTALGVTTMLLGPSPTGIVMWTRFESGFTRVTVPSRSFATHTASRPTATAFALLPATTDVTTLLVWASILVRLPVDSLVTHTEPAPTATPSALWPATKIGLSGLPVRRSIGVTVPSSAFATQRSRASAATADGPLPTGMRLTTPGRLHTHRRFRG